ncbi:MAG: hypothetical protein ACJAT2_002611 [Bacteriovoracaceae bacterium]|jgi:hypothetical protein
MANANAIAPIAMVSAVKGNAFIHHLGKTKKIKVGDHIHNFSEIFTEVGSQVSFSDYYDHQYHLAGSGHLKLNGKTVELQGGYLWLQSFNREESFAVETANAHVNYMYGESVISFNSFDGKTQIMTISGGWDFSNKFEKYRTTRLQEGQFSFISKDYEGGSPRHPTPIGQGSFSKVTGLFGGVKRLNQQASRDFQVHANVQKSESTGFKVPMVKRGIASQIEGDQFPTRSEEDSTALIREIAAAGSAPTTSPSYKPTFKKTPSTTEKESFLRYYNSRVSNMKPTKKVRKNRVNYKKKSGAKIFVYGADWAPKAQKISGDIRVYDPKRLEAAEKLSQKPVVKKEVKQRAPASVTKKLEAPKDVFESTLRKEFKKQTRHTSEINDLINELQSYDQDYQRSY